MVPRLDQSSRRRPRTTCRRRSKIRLRGAGMSDDQVIRTSGTLPVAQHLRPKPRQHPHWYLRYIRRGPPEPGHGDWQCGFSTTTTRSSGPSGARHEHRTGGPAVRPPGSASNPRRWMMMTTTTLPWKRPTPNGMRWPTEVGTDRPADHASWRRCNGAVCGAPFQQVPRRRNRHDRPCEVDGDPRFRIPGRERRSMSTRFRSWTSVAASTA